MTKNTNTPTYLVEYNGDFGVWIGVHQEGMNTYNVILFSSGDYSGQEMLCYDIPELKWLGKQPTENQTVMFADQLEKYKLF